jgi:hypothetical protein
MDQLIRLLDANPHGTALNPPDSSGAGNASPEEHYPSGEPQRAALESSVFALITGVLMSGSLVAAVGTLITAITRVLG